MRLEPALTVERRHASAACSGDRLPVDCVLYVAAREHPRDVGVGRAGLGHEVASVVLVECAAKDSGVGSVANGENPSYQQTNIFSAKIDGTIRMQGNVLIFPQN